MRILISILLISATSCNRETATKAAAHAKVHGQVFVIRKDRLNVKLGGVTIHYIGAKALQDRAQWIALNSDRMRHLRIYRENLSESKEWIRQTAQERTFQPEFRTFIRQTEEVINEAERKLNENPLLGEICRIEDIRRDNTNLFSQTEFNSNSNSQWIIGSIFFDWLEQNASNTAETNADGIFQISIPAESKGYILAQASRSLTSSSEEHYYWIKEVAGTGDEEIMLSSLATVSPESLVDILNFPAHARQSSMSSVQKEFSLISLDWVSQCQNTMRQIQANEKRSAMLDEKIKSLEERIGQVKYESTP